MLEKFKILNKYEFEYSIGFFVLFSFVKIELLLKGRFS